MVTREDVFWSLVDRAGDCWEWTGSVDVYGYGQFNYEGRNWKTHRLSLYFYGEILLPWPTVVDHTCWNPKCVNPKHLRQVHNKENNANHRPECACRICSARRRGPIFCIRGHDKRMVGTYRPYDRCAECVRENQRKYTRARRERRQNETKQQG